MTARVVTAGELTKLRRDGQSARIFLAVHVPATVFSARVATGPASLDRVVEVSYASGVGTTTDVLVGMTLYVGSSAGAWDKGMVRIRKAIAGGKLFIGETSDVAFAAGDYLTVVNEFGLWPRLLDVNLSTVTEYMDYDVAYSDQHSKPDPVVLMGGHRAVWLIETGDGPEVETAWDASESWVLLSTVSGYAWTCAGATVTGGTTATPTITFTSAGTYQVACTVTAANGKTSTGRRVVFVYDGNNLPVQDVELVSCQGSADGGGWTARLRVWGDASETVIRDRALVVVFAEDVFGTEIVSLGPLSGCENVIFSGWVDGESIVINDDVEGSVEFEAQGPQGQLRKMTNRPAWIENNAGAAWRYFSGLTVDAFVWHMCHWRSTIDGVMDVTRSAIGTAVFSLVVEQDNLWDQIRSAGRHLLAEAACDRYGRLFVERHGQYLSSRTGVVVVMDLTEADVEASAMVERVVTGETGQARLTGVAFTGGAAVALGGVSPGTAPGRFGSVEEVGELALVDQTEAITLAGLYVGRRNNEAPRMAVRLGQNNRFIDVAPQQLVRMSVTADASGRGLVWTNRRFWPASVSWGVDGRSGAVDVDLELEAETFAANAVKYEFPGSGGGGVVVPPSDPPKPPPVVDPPVPPTPGILPVLVTTGMYIGLTEAITSGSVAWIEVTP